MATALDCLSLGRAAAKLAFVRNTTVAPPSESQPAHKPHRPRNRGRFMFKGRTGGMSAKI